MRCATSQIQSEERSDGSTILTEPLEEPPSIDGNEITDKGSINQRATLTRRAASVEELYAGSPAAITV